MSLDIVIGSCYGDEAKGLTTARIAKAYNDYDNTVVILNNGGAQRGHSVYYNGKEHIFQHFGSATPLNVSSYFGPSFILNPIQFVKEQNEIFSLYGFRPVSKRSSQCRWSTPWDMMANQIHQKEKWTGSCGMGIWETCKRHLIYVGALKFDEFCALDYNKKVLYLKSIRDCYFSDIKVTSEYKDAWFSEDTIKHFICDCIKMFRVCPVDDELLENKKHLIIENGQGLLLSDNGKDDIEKTPSYTGIETLFDLDKSLMTEKPIVHFVTRPYLTRHGSANWVNNKPQHFIDKSAETNHYNEWQHELCYAALNIDDLKNRCNNEVGKIGLKDYIVEVTHCDELDAESDFKRFFKNQKINFYGTKEL